MAGGYDGLKTSHAAGRGSSRCVVEDFLRKIRTKYPATKQALTNGALKPTKFTAFAELQSRKLRPGETVHMYVHHLKRLLDAAMPELDEDSKNKVLFQQFLAGVPDECSRILRANPDITTSEGRSYESQALLTVSVEKSALSVAAVTDAPSEVRALQDSVTEQMSTLMEKLPFSPRLLFQSDAIIVTALDTYHGTADSQDVSQCATAAINLDM
eukprot:Em0024g421a